MNVKVSIIIPAYNMSSFLGYCLSSCINQTFVDLEIIVVNDGSTDTTSDVIKEYAALDERIVMVDQNNQGVIYARKSGLEVARGEYVFYLDGDDYIEKNAISELYSEAIKRNADYVVGNFYTVYGDNREKSCAISEINGLSGQNLLIDLLNGFCWSLCGRLIRKTLFDERIVYKPIAMGEDLFINMQITLNVKQAAYIELYVYNYVRHSLSVTCRHNDNAITMNIEMVEAIFDLFDIHDYEQRIINKVSLLFFPFFLSCIRKNVPDTDNRLRTYYWNKEEIRSMLWRKRKFFYLACGGYLYFPVLSRIGIEVGWRGISLLRKTRFQ